MDISNEANVDIFSIGPSSIVGRTIAFRVLFCKSMSQFWHQWVHTMLELMRAFRGHVSPYLSWFHPQNPKGILAMVTIIAFVLKRYTNVKRTAELAYRRKFWRNVMKTASNYEEWAHAAKMLEKESPRMNEAEFYDEELVGNKLQELRHRRQEGSLRDIMFCMRADLIRNLGNMCNPELHKRRLQVPRLIKEYIDEVTTQLRMVCDSDSEELILEEKLAFMHETRHAFGRTALLLSGGASFGSFHVGAVKTLVNHKLCPRIIAGSSVGAITCAVVGTRSWPEVESFFEDSWYSVEFFDQMDGIFTIVKRVMTLGVVHEIRLLQMKLRTLTNNLTFQEAYDMTGRVLGITVSSPRKHEPPRCLNYLTSPNVLIWSAVTASCAFPGLFEAQELMAKDRTGDLVPYHPPFHLGPEEGTFPSRRWRDGSLESDLPVMQLKELFNVNHFIVSQANPHISPLLRLKEFAKTYGGNFAAKLAHIAEMEVKHRCNQLLELGLPMGGIAKLFAQAWEGDVTVVMPATLAQYLRIIQNPSYGERQKVANQGRMCIWEKLSVIKANCAIELALDDCVAILNSKRRLKRRAQRVAADVIASQTHASNISNTCVNVSAFGRIPSWNCIVRENSTGSLDEELLAEVGSLQEVGSSAVSGGSSLSHHHKTFPTLHDGNDSESETIDLNKWTRSGGPLMRSKSANNFIDFIQGLDLDVEINQTLTGHLNSSVMQTVSRESTRAATDRNSETEDFRNRGMNGSSSITFTDGDLLQPEQIHNGIVFNIIKKEEFTVSAQSNDSESFNSLPSSAAECVDLECPDRETDTSSESEHHEDNDNNGDIDNNINNISNNNNNNNNNSDVDGDNVEDDEKNPCKVDPYSVSDDHPCEENEKNHQIVHSDAKD